jgi:hypothetical protein
MEHNFMIMMNIPQDAIKFKQELMDFVFNLKLQAEE